MPVSRSSDLFFKVRFGGGLNTASSEDDVSEGEATSGQNFNLDFNNRNLKPRRAIKHLGTAPYGHEIRGFVNLVNANGESTILVQSGGNVYNWSSLIGFVSVGSVPSTSRIRGHLHHYWALEDSVFITDLNLQSPVLMWNGSALTTMTHNLTGDFKAKYCWIDNERARFGNVVSNSTATPHMVVTSEVSNYQTLSVSNKPSSSLGAGDAYYLLSPDLRPINGMAGFFESLAISTEKGSIFKIVGADSTDTTISPYYQRSFATGDESMTFVGNDLIYGRTGRLESLTSTQNYGDVASDDLTSKIKNLITDLSDWSISYNPRTQKIYAYPSGQDFLLQYSKDVSLQDVSPWVKITTNNSFSMAITCMMCMVDPVDNVEYTYIGDALGNLYIIEGDVGAQDMGQNDVVTSWRSGLFKLDNQLISDEYKGYITYRSGQDATVTVKLLHAGSYVNDSTCDILLVGSTGGEYFGSTTYFGGDVYFGTPFEGRFRREEFTPEGGSEEVQIEISHTGSAGFEINEVGFSFSAKTNP